MSYPSQPGYPTPQYGGQPQSPQQNNLWMIGAAIVVVLIIIMTVILLVVQQTSIEDGADGGDGGTTGEPDPTGDDGGGDDSTGSDGGDEGSDGGAATEINADACDAFDMSQFETAYGAYDPDETYRSASTSNGLSSLNCTFYNADFTSVNVYVTDYEDAASVKEWVESDAEYYTEADGYVFSEYTEIGDAGSMYSKEETDYKTINLHVALGSLEVKVYTSLWTNESVEEEAAIATMEDFIKQSETLFADYQ